MRETYNFLLSNNNIAEFEFICIDDGSTDSTRKIIEEIKKDKPQIKINQKRENRGKGYSVKEGINMAANEYILFFDADLSTPLKEINNFLEESKNNNADIIIGSRNSNLSKTSRSFKRTIISKTFAILKKIICNIYYEDTQCGFKMFKKEVAKNIFNKITIDGFSFDVELLVIAKKLNYKVVSKPIEWHEAKSTSLNIFKQTIKMLKELFIIRSNDKRGLYN